MTKLLALATHQTSSVPTTIEEPLVNIVRRAFTGHSLSLDLWRHMPIGPVETAKWRNTTVEPAPESSLRQAMQSLNSCDA